MARAGGCKSALIHEKVEAEAVATNRLRRQRQRRPHDDKSANRCRSDRPIAVAARRAAHLRPVRRYQPSVLRRALPARSRHDARPDPRRAQRRLYGRCLRAGVGPGRGMRGAERRWRDLSPAGARGGERVIFSSARLHFGRARHLARPLSAHSTRSAGAVQARHEMEHDDRHRLAAPGRVQNRLSGNDDRRAGSCPHLHPLRRPEAAGGRGRHLG